MEAPDKILYLALRARAEPTRIIYALADKPLTDERIARKDWGQQKAEQPLGQVPVFTCAEGTLVMSNTIARYAAKKFGMVGENLWEETLNDLIVEACCETFGMLGPKILKWKILKIDKEPENSEKLLEETYRELLKTLDYVQKVAEKRGAQFLTCDKLSLADVWLFCSLQHGEVIYPDIMEVNPWVKEFVSKVQSDERMKKYLSERPVTVL